MAAMIDTNGRTTHLLTLMQKGDDAFNAHDVAAMKATHHPDMIAHVTGSAEPIYGRTAHAQLMAQMIHAFLMSRCRTTRIRSSSEAATGSPS